MPIAKQGLDGLCGVYSLVNVYNALFVTSANKNTELFSELIRAIPKRHFPNVIIDGLDSTLLLRLINKFIKYCDDGNITIKCDQLLQENENKRGFINKLRSYLICNGDSRPRVVLVGIEGCINHWSVIYICKNKLVGLWDSGPMRAIKFKDLGVGNNAHMPYTIVRNEVWGFRLKPVNKSS